MAPLVHSVEIDRGPDEVFDYVTDPAHFTEWQDNVVSARPLGDGQRRQGAQLELTRRIGGREQTMTGELTEWEPPRRYAFRIVEGPVRARGTGTLEPLDGGRRTRFTMELDFEGHGIGKLLVPLVVRRQAAKELTETHAKLKRRLEGEGGAAGPDAVAPQE